MMPPTFHTPSLVLEAVRRLVDEVPAAAVGSLATAIGSSSAGEWIAIRAQAQKAVAHPHYRACVGHLVDVWQREAPDLAPASIALALEVAAHSVGVTRSAQVLDLVWTGPQGGMLRRIDQALLQLINEAQRDLLIVTFAAYKVGNIRAALGRAIERGIRVRIVIESPLESEGKLAYDGLVALGPGVAERALVYRWPLQQRPVDEAGRHGSLHVKCAVADERVLLISSANLTSHALTLNMEMGLLITGGLLPHQVAQHFESLIRAGLLLVV